MLRARHVQSLSSTVSICPGQHATKLPRSRRWAVILAQLMPLDVDDIVPLATSASASNDPHSCCLSLSSAPMPHTVVHHRLCVADRPIVSEASAGLMPHRCLMPPSTLGALAPHLAHPCHCNCWRLTPDDPVGPPISLFVRAFRLPCLIRVLRLRLPLRPSRTNGQGRSYNIRIDQP